MKPKSHFSHLIFILSITIINAEEVNYVDILENLHPLKIIKGMQENLDSESPCLEDIKEYENGLSSNQFWALKMFDSSAKVGDGVLLRTNAFLGQFDECNEVVHPEKNFTGKYCILLANINHTSIPKLYVLPAETYPSTYFLFATCLPSTCSESEIELPLKYMFRKTDFNDSISISTLEELELELCLTKKSSSELSVGAWAAIVLLVLFALIALASTFYDAYQDHALNTSKPCLLLTFFSLYQNGRQLFKVSNSPDQLKMLNGIRVLSTCWIVLHNGYSLILYVSPSADRVGVSKTRMDNNHVILTFGYIAVDSFFFLSGLLAALVFFQDMAKKGHYDVPLAYIHRYIRLTPPYAIAILITATLYSHFGDGPIWNLTTSCVTSACEKNWWLGLLYIDNYIEFYNQCIGTTWYLAADMQLHWISPLILYPLYFWPSLAPFFLSVVILGATFITFTIAYVNDLGPSAEISSSDLQETLDYFPFHTRAAPWLVGVALAYAICTVKSRKMKIRLPKFWVIIGWMASAGLCLSSLYGAISFTDYKYTLLEAAFYLSFHRLAWGLGLAWIVFACLYGYGGPVNNFLSWSFFQPLGKLTYCAYLVHFPVIIYRIGVLRVNIQGSDTETVNSFMSDLMLSFLIAIPLTLLFEMPFRNMYRHFFQNVKILPIPKQKKQTKESYNIDAESKEEKERDEFVE